MLSTAFITLAVFIPTVMILCAALALQGRTLPLYSADVVDYLADAHRDDNALCALIRQNIPTVERHATTGDTAAALARMSPSLAKGARTYWTRKLAKGGWSWGRTGVALATLDTPSEMAQFDDATAAIADHLDRWTGGQWGADFIALQLHLQGYRGALEFLSNHAQAKN